ncbi:MAG: DUF3408 domain-containing protein, partial [Tannerellaceae bacterium]|nr:DUF3408 domain-containing protein [Tannerellaceae bacterium]
MLTSPVYLIQPSPNPLKQSCQDKSGTSCTHTKRYRAEDMPEAMQTGKQTDKHAEVPNEIPEPAEEKPAKRKRGQAADYEGLFLSRNELRDRQGLYIGR